MACVCADDGMVRSSMVAVAVGFWLLFLSRRRVNEGSAKMHNAQ